MHCAAYERLNPLTHRSVSPLIGGYGLPIGGRILPFACNCCPFVVCKVTHLEPILDADKEEEERGKRSICQGAHTNFLPRQSSKSAPNRSDSDC